MVSEPQSLGLQGPRQLGGVQCQGHTLQNKHCLEKMLSCCSFGSVFPKKINGTRKEKCRSGVKEESELYFLIWTENRAF